MLIRAFLLLAAIAAAVLGAAPIRAQTITMGDSAIEAADDGDNANLEVAQAAMLVQAATLNTMSFFVTSPAGSLRLAVYDASGPHGQPGKLLAKTGSFTAIAGWNTVRTTTSPMLAAGNYWLAYLPSNNALGFKKQNNSGPCFYHSRSFTNGFPAIFPTSPNNCTPTTWSFYASLTGGPPPPPPTPVAISFTPSSPSLPDTSTSGALISAISVSTSNGSKFTGSLSLTANPASTAGVVGSNLDLARNLSPTDDGSIGPFTVQATENGGTVSGNVTLTVTSAPPPTLTLTVMPAAPSISSTAPLGSIVANVTAAWSNGSQFTGSLGFVAPYNDDGGTFALSCTQCANSNLIVSPTGMGVSGDGGTVQNVALQAVQ